jgi:hypothetical protein
MKKLIYTLSAAVLVAFSSCKNESSVNPIPVDQIVSNVTISGLVKAEQNNLTPGPENVPNGTGTSPAIKVIAEISTSYLVVSTGEVSYVNKYYETTVVDGKYSLTVEAGPRGSEGKLYFSAFRGDVSNTNNATPPVTTVTSKLFSLQERGLSVIKGRSELIDVTYP